MAESGQVGKIYTRYRKMSHDLPAVKIKPNTFPASLIKHLNESGNPLARPTCVMNLDFNPLLAALVTFMQFSHDRHDQVGRQRIADNAVDCVKIHIPRHLGMAYPLPTWFIITDLNTGIR